MFNYLQALIKRKKDKMAEERLINELDKFKKKTESLNYLREELESVLKKQESTERETLLQELSATYKSVIDINEIK